MSQCCTKVSLAVHLHQDEQEKVAKGAIGLFKNNFESFESYSKIKKFRRVLHEMPTRCKGQFFDVFGVAKTAIVLFKNSS